MARRKYVGKMEGKVAIVTGGTKGIGAAIVEKILAEGGQVVFTSRKEAEGAAKLAELKNENAAYIVADATSKADWEKVVAYTLEKFGKITSLVNNAGICPSAPVMQITEEGMLNTFKLNLMSQLLGMQAVHDAMVANGGGAIVNFASPSARVGGPGMGEYTATKHAVEGLVKCAAIEWGCEGIRVCGMIPG
ncbi:MAG: SDR family oxidoreductase, partial [Oscillospiraceae bacterium]|nr:SDR family oxidoreductase [Oscillospiraceae bacterium]